MALSHRSVLANEVRVPKVVRGEVVIVKPYDKDPKVALINPEDLAMLEDDHQLISRLREITTLSPDDLTVKAQQLEDQPAESSITDPAEIAALLGL